MIGYEVDWYWVVMVGVCGLVAAITPVCIALHVRDVLRVRRERNKGLRRHDQNSP